ncbi:MAG: hypothetical protein ACRBB6_08685 [Neptuniibacter sp.]
MKMYAYDTARKVTPEEFKKSCQDFHRNNRNHLDLSLSQLQQQLAKSLGFSDLHGLKNNSNVVIEFSRMRDALKLLYPVSSALFDSFFSSGFINTGSEGCLYLAINGLGTQEIYIDSSPYMDDGRGLYREGADFIKLGDAVALPLADWVNFITEVETQLKQLDSTDEDEQINEILNLFGQIENVQSYFSPYDYVGSYPELQEVINSIEKLTKSELRKALADWYSLPDDYMTPLSDLIEFHEDVLDITS